MVLWFSSDLHFGHENIQKFEPGRLALGTNIVDHDQNLIARFNRVVAPDDYLFILGDVGLAGTKYLEQCVSALHGTKILVRGNHDKHTDAWYRRMGFEVVCHEMKIKMAGQLVLLSHYPYAKPWWWRFLPWKFVSPDNHKRPVDCGLPLLHGHIHSGGGSVKTHRVRGRQINVGVDCWDYLPVRWDTLEKEVSRCLKL